MKVTAIYVYPVKALRGIRLHAARLGPQGVEHDRRFMLCRVKDDGSGELAQVQLARHPECSLFAQLVGDEIHIRHLAPGRPDPDPDPDPAPDPGAVLRVPLRPATAGLARACVNLHQSLADAYRMGAPYDAWFSARLGFDTALVYIGDARRSVLGTLAPAEPDAGAPPPWLGFSDVAPFLFTCEQSLRNVSARLATGGGVAMAQFRPNIVVDGAAAAFDEDFWAALAVNGVPAFALTKMCGRCVSIDVDYATGRRAEGERGAVLKKLMADRRVDAGNRWVPVFGKYGFLARGRDALELRVGDDVEVTERLAERPVFDWPLTPSKGEARLYQYAEGG